MDDYVSLVFSAQKSEYINYSTIPWIKPENSFEISYFYLKKPKKKQIKFVKGDWNIHDYLFLTKTFNAKTVIARINIR